MEPEPLQLRRVTHGAPRPIDLLQVLFGHRAGDHVRVPDHTRER